MTINTLSCLVRAPTVIHETICVWLTPKEQAHLEVTCSLFRNVILKIYAERALSSTEPTFFTKIVPSIGDRAVSKSGFVSEWITIRVTDLYTKLPIRVFKGIVNEKIERENTYGEIWHGKNKIKCISREAESCRLDVSLLDEKDTPFVLFNDVIRIIKATPDETKVIVLCGDCCKYCLRVSDLTTKITTTYKLIGCNSSIRSMHITPDSRTAILADSDYNITFADLEKCQIRHVIKADVECIPMTEDPALFDAGIALFDIRDRLRDAQVEKLSPLTIVPVIFRQILDLPPIVSTPILENLPYGEYSSIEKVIEAIDQFTQATAHKEVSEGKRD